MRIDISAASITLRVGQVLELSAPAELGAGYSWAVTETPPILAPQGEAGVARDPAEEGGKDRQVFTFRATQPGVGELALAYRRPWEREVPPRDERRIPVTVLAN
jgi:inhibitor of cysteine peptidase